jgi:hypothetical protein
MKTKEELIKLIPKETAYRAFVNVSFNPEIRGESQRDSFATEIIKLYDELIKLDPERIAEIEQDIEDYTQRLLKKELAWLGAKSRTISPMITGPANFPAQRNQKALDTEHNRVTEYLEYREKASLGLKRKYKKVVVIDIQKLIQGYKERGLNNLLKEGLYRKLINIAKDDRMEEVQEALKDISNIFTSRHKIHRELQEMIEQKTAVNITETINNVEIVDNIQDNRIQLFFNSKPDSEMITYLKSKAWKWTPSKQCWQNYRSNSRLTEIKNKIKGLK